MGLSIALLHYPTVNKAGKTVTTSVTNFDIHDIARAARTYGVDRFYIVTPIAMQRDFVHRIMRHWMEEEGADYNPTRGDALTTVEVLPDLAAVAEAVDRDFGAPPSWVATSARASGAVIATEQLRKRIASGRENICLLFGTGYGLHPDLYEYADALLEPIRGPTDYNHLAVRSAVSIYLDRLMRPGADSGHAPAPEPREPC